MTDLPQTHDYGAGPRRAWYPFRVEFATAAGPWTVQLMAASPADAHTRARAVLADYRARRVQLARISSPVNGMYAPPLTRPDGV